MANTNSKVTYSSALAYVLGLELPTEISDKLTDLKASVEKKSGSKKSATEKDENKALIAEIERVLSATPNITVSEIIVNGEFPVGTSTQKITAMVKAMPNVVKVTDKKKSLFSLAE